jgi:hypothetical protein
MRNDLRLAEMSVANSTLGLRQRIPRTSPSEVTQELLEPSSSPTINYRDGELNQSYNYRTRTYAFSSPKPRLSILI